MLYAIKMVLLYVFIAVLAGLMGAGVGMGVGVNP